MANPEPPFGLPDADYAAVAVVAAHPDDEVIGASVLLNELPRVLLIQVTDGAPRDLHDARAAGCSTRAAYAALRSAERRDALRDAASRGLQVVDLAIPDQEATAALVSLTQRLGALLLGHRVKTVITHAYEGGHPDHDATSFAVHAVARRREIHPPLTLLEMTGYHAADGAMAVGGFLPHPRAGDVRTVRLAAHQVARKARMIVAYRSQRAVLAPFPLDVERFRVAPAYDFSRPPHDGKLWYEWFGWGLPGGGREWRARAAAASQILGVPLDPTPTASAAGDT